VLLSGPDDLWVLFLEAAFAMMAAGKYEISAATALYHHQRFQAMFPYVQDAGNSCKTTTHNLRQQ
jgi:hypothetical protein